MRISSAARSGEVSGPRSKRASRRRRGRLAGAASRCRPSARASRGGSSSSVRIASSRSMVTVRVGSCSSAFSSASAAPSGSRAGPAGARPA
jgi:hypothetical protein